MFKPGAYHYFLSAHLSAANPRLDLSLIYELKMYRQTLPRFFKNKIVAEALSSCRTHLCYQCPEHAVFALFALTDVGISETEKD